ncbi:MULTISPECIES: MFS transporter [unclassified Streptomyces]|uniref:MFS transporter n=1 Tax=unclassified Streptomyces TaxID=2593676 RepID=UPI0016611087|nr:MULTISPECIES: MFS transporter [unclassified Streptomyces]
MPSRAGAGFITSLTGAYFGTWLALLPAAQITLALRVQQIAPDNKAGVLSLVLSAGAVVALLGQNVFGLLSDRTTSRFGMRRPWIAAGAVSGALSLLLLANASSVPVLVVAWALTQLTFNALLAGLNPVVLDQVPSSQIGRVAALVGLTTQLGVAGGAFLVQALLPDLTLALLVPALVCLVGTGVLLKVLPDRRLARADRPPMTWRTLLRAYWVSPRRAPDFAWAWLSRFLVGFGNVTLSSYQTYFLMDRFGYDEDSIGGVVFQALLVNAIGVVLASLVFGALSDRMGRRKPFVLLSAIVLALAHVLATFAPSLGWYLAATALAGIAGGCYLAVDLALVAQVLPSRADTGKDMSVFHLAQVLPQSVAPVVAPVFLALGGGDNYAAFFLAGAVIGLVGAVCTQRIKSVS